MIDWWLFEYQKGFCQYYASAEIILLRSLGIPARMAVGYAEGEFIPDGALQSFGDRDRFADITTGTYIVRQHDAHAWPEVYFPGYGWIEFEPTASQLPVVRPAAPAGTGTNPANAPLLREPNLEDNEDVLPDLPRNSSVLPKTGSPLLEAIAYLLAAAALGLLSYMVYTQRAKLQSSLLTIPIKIDHGFQRAGIKSPAFLKRWASYASLAPVQRSYLEINRALRRLGQPPADGLTPAERAASLEGILPSSGPYVTVLLTEYEHSIYSLIPANRVQAQTAGAQVRTLSYKALIERFLSRFRRKPPLKK
jgi:hypothetical protein